MNREDARKNAKIMLAYADGAEIEYRERGKEWGEPYCLTFNHSEFEYRVKPKAPDRIWVNVYDSGITALLTEKEATRVSQNPQATAVEYVRK